MDQMMTFFSDYGDQLLFKTWEHLYISFIAIGLGIIVAVPSGVLLTRAPKLANGIMALVGVLQTFPTLAVLAFFIPLIGIGKVPAIIALFIYSLLPILRNTYTGVKDLDENLKEAGRGMGMTVREQIMHVELPLAIPIIMAGIRMSAVYLIGWATLAAYIGAGGLGDFIFDGLNLFKPEFILAGAIPTTLIAIILDFLFGRLEVALTPKGIRDKNATKNPA